MYLSERPRTGSGPQASAPEREGRLGGDLQGGGHEPGDRQGDVRPRGRGRRGVGGTVVLLGLVSLLTDVSSESVSAVLPLYLTAVLGLSPLAYGFVDGLYQGVSALVRILGGWLSDRADRPKWVAFAGYGLSAVTKVFLLLAQGLGAVTTVITLDRLGKGLRTAPRDAIIAASTPPHALGRAFGVHRALDTTGAAIGPLLAFAILWFVPGDYRGVFLASLAAAVLGLALLGLMVPDLRPRRGAATTRAASGAAAAAPASGPAPTAPTAPDGPSPGPAPLATPSWRSLRDRSFARVVLASGVLGVLTISDGFLYLSLQQRDSFAATWFPLLFVGTNVAYLALAVPFGRLSDRLGRARVLVGGHVLLVGAYLLAALPSGGLGLTIGCLVALGAFYAATDGVLAALTSQLVPAGARARGIATAQTVQALARFGSSLVFGALWTGLGRGPAVVAVAAALAVAVVACGWLLRGLGGSTPAGSEVAA
ncbi:MFS transporter [Pedococcus sp. NPDC057267]|uniref:MFS transporter n=1 Tax=Pedococcus sp. NPDC057267 TaxID=3346077 RepID=UPI0036299B52